jgi:hypothetical protein
MVLAIEREERCEHAVPSAMVARDQPKLLPLLAQARVERLLELLDLVFVVTELRSEAIHIHHQHEPLHREDHEVERQLAQALRDRVVPGLEHHLEPEREASRIEARVVPHRVLAPQILVEHALELRGRRQRDQLASALEPERVDELSEHRGRQLAHGGDEPRIFEHVTEEARG